MWKLRERGSLGIFLWSLMMSMSRRRPELGACSAELEETSAIHAHHHRPDSDLDNCWYIPYPLTPFGGHLVGWAPRRRVILHPVYKSRLELKNLNISAFMCQEIRKVLKLPCEAQGIRSLCLFHLSRQSGSYGGASVQDISNFLEV